MGFTVDIKGNASHLDKTIKNVKTSLSAIGSVATTAATSLAGIGVAGGAAMTAFIVSSSKAAIGMESITTQFEVLTGSAKEAADLVKTFRQEAVKSPLSTEDYANAAKGFMSYGMEAKKVLPVLKMLGDVSMGNSERFGLLSYAMAQVASNTSLKGDDLRQLVAQGFNPLAIIADKTGRSMQDLRKDMEESKITYGMVEEALKSVTSEGGRFFGAIEKGAGTTDGKIAKVKDSIFSLQVAFGTGFNEGLKDALDATNTFLPQLETKFATAGSMLGGAITEAVNGNTEQISEVGGLIGEVLWAGVKASFQKGADSLISDLVPSLIEGYASLAPNKTVGGVLSGAAQSYRGVVGESSPLSGYMQTAIENVQGSGSLNTLQKAEDKRDLAAALKKGILDSNMTKAVREGVLEAWKQQAGAKFSN